MLTKRSHQNVLKCPSTLALKSFEQFYNYHISDLNRLLSRNLKFYNLPHWRIQGGRQGRANSIFFYFHAVFHKLLAK